MKFLFLVIPLVFFLSCNVEHDATSFNRVLDVPAGEDVTVSTDEDIPLDWVYNVERNADSRSLQLKMVKEPSHGKLENCNHVSDVEMGCKYIPDPNFYGTDTIEFYTTDGDFKADRRSVITINVVKIPDPPRALNDSLNAKSGQLVEFQLPEGLDEDSLKEELNYEIISCDKGLEIECEKRNCSFKTNDLYVGDSTLTYQIIDEEGMRSNEANIEINITPELKNLTDTFTYDVDNLQAVDIIWVVDNSGSMEGEQATLKANFTSFIDNFLVDGKARFPFKMAIITTDTYKMSNGEQPYVADSIGNMYDLSSTRAENDFAGFKADFEAAVLVGIDGSGAEKSIKSMERAYELGPSFYGGNESLLTYIIVSDEKEQSTDKTIPEWVTHFQGLKDSPEKLLIFPIVRLSKDDGDRYKDVADLTKTKLFNIDNSFSEILNDISLAVSERVASFSLNQEVNIIQESIVVTINGQPSTDFEFSAEYNSIKINNAPNEPLSTIKIMYSFYGPKGYDGTPE